MNNPPIDRPEMACTSLRAGPQQRRRTRVAAVIVSLSLATLTGCYQVPEWADPVKLAQKAAIEFDSAANQMERYLFEGQVPGSNGTPGKTQSAKAEMQAAKPVMPQSDSSPAAAPAAADSGETPTFDVALKPSAAHAIAPATPVAAPAAGPTTTSPREREVLQGLIDATGESEHKPTEETDYAANGAAPVSLTPRKDGMEPDRDAADGRQFAVHLASYREMRNLRKDWKRMVKRHPEFLLGLKARVAKVDLGPRKGKFHRLKAGPLPSRKFARRLCRSLRDRGLYCAVMRFTGGHLAMVGPDPKG